MEHELTGLDQIKLNYSEDNQETRKGDKCVMCNMNCVIHSMNCLRHCKTCKIKTQKNKIKFQAPAISS